eukprot:GHUV01034562.1.p3 GENE.GHUV01034562.1~~GHUV01034562.1.p3  ORF type:complete len:118 (+),score=54.81 GHUV01034562.1:711-1064(+)
MYSHRALLFIALSPAGPAVDKTTAAAPHVQQGMRTALNKLHQRGILHGDIHLSNFCVAEDATVKIIDFDQAAVYDRGAAETAATKALFEREVDELERLFQQATIAAVTTTAAAAATT